MITTVEAKIVLKSILNVRCREGATIAEIQDDFEEITGKALPDIHNLLYSIDSVYCIECPNEKPRWFVKSVASEHVNKLILEQKPPQPKPFRSKAFNQHRSNVENSKSISDCFFKDNVVYKRKYKNHPYQTNDANNNDHFNGYHNEPISTTPTLPKPLLHAQLVGDDFFRVLSSHDSIQMLNRENGIQHKGLCISGLSIQAAKKMIECTHHFKSLNLLINVGSVDILHGHDLAEMYSNFDQLIWVCEQRGLQPIITNLAPLANSWFSPEMRKKLLAFNNFLWDEYFTRYPIIDLYKQMTTSSGRMDYTCFKTESNWVSGSDRPHVLWNQKGQHLIRNHIEWYLSKVLKIEFPERVRFAA